MISKDIIQRLLRRRFILPLIALFLVNILLICYEPNTGSEQKFFFNGFQCINATIIAMSLNIIATKIALKYHYFRKIIIFLGSILGGVSLVIFDVCDKVSQNSMDGQMSDDSRLEIRCTQLIVSQIALIVLLLMH